MEQSRLQSALAETGACSGFFTKQRPLAATLLREELKNVSCHVYFCLENIPHFSRNSAEMSSSPNPASIRRR